MPIFEDVAADSAVSRAREAVGRALALDSTLVEAHTALARSEMMVWRNRTAQQEFEHAIRLDSNYSTAHLQYGILLKHLGRHDDAILEITRARALDPQSLIANTMLGAPAHYFLGELLAAQKKFDEAIRSAKRSMEASGDRNSRAVAWLAQAYALSGHVTEARALLRELLERSKHERVSGAGLALLYDALGERERAIPWLRKSVAEYDLNLENHNPRFDALRADPRAVALLAITEAMK
jgi:tetratricopeptide (TPR) repeat protein